MNNTITVTFAERKTWELELLYSPKVEIETRLYKKMVEHTVTDERVNILSRMDYKELSIIIEGILNNE